MPKKHALLIANTDYRDGKLASLSHPGLAYAELAEALRDPSRGAFSQVETLVNSNLSHVLNTLDRFFARKPADDILLVYVGAHGFVDSQGELFLALKESDRFRLKSTALMAAVLGMNMDQCPSPHKLIILDYRLHTPYQDSRGASATVKVDPAKVFAGRGMPKLILAAAEQPAAAAPTAPAATSSTQKIQVVAPRDLTRALAATFRSPSALGGARSAFSVDDWWSAAAAELRASKAEPPTRHAVGEPPLTILRGASLPRPELALSAGNGESQPLLANLPQEPESDWSRLSGIFPLEMFAPELAPKLAPKPSGGEAPAVEGNPDDPEGNPDDSPFDRTLTMPVLRGDQTVIFEAPFLEDSPPEPMTPGIEGPVTSAQAAALDVPMMEGLVSAEGEVRQAAGASRPEAPAGEPPVQARRPDATLFYDLRLPPDLSGNSTMSWDRPKEEETREHPLQPAQVQAPFQAPASTHVPASTQAPAPTQPPATRFSPPLGPRDTFTDLRARLKAQEEEERKARLDADREEAAQREKLDLWKARWDSRNLAQGTAPAEAKAKAGESPSVPPESAAADALGGKPKPSNYQARVAALQKTLLVPGPDGESAEGAARPPTPEAPATPPPPAVPAGLATVMVSKDQFLNTGTHKAITELTPGATLHVSRDPLRTAPPAAASGADATRVESDPARPAASKAAAPQRPESRDARGGRTTGAHPRVARRGGEGGGRRKAALWILAGMLPVGLGLFLFFGYHAGLFAPFGFGGAEPAPRAAAPRPPASSNRPVSQAVPAAPVAPVPAQAPEGEDPSLAAQVPDDVLDPAASAEGNPAGSAAQAAPSPQVDPGPSAPSAQNAASAQAAPATQPPAPGPAPYSALAAPETPASKPAISPAKVPAAAPARSSESVRASESARASQAARLAKAQADSLRRAEAALRKAEEAARRESLKAAKAAQEAERKALAKARNDSLRAARFAQDSLLTARAQAKQDSLVQARYLRDQERARKAEAEKARLALARAKQDSIRAASDSVNAEAALRKSVQQAMRADTEELRGLYNRFALGYPGLRGEVVVDILVAPSGEIEKGSVTASTTGNRMFDQLVLGNVMQWKIRPFKSRVARTVQVGLQFPIE